MLKPVAILLAASVASPVNALRRDLNIVNKNLAPDGFTRSTVVAEGVFPGPLITGNKGDNFKINVINKLHDHTMLQSTSIHWHGFFQKGTNWADGPSFVNQCPISANHSFLYDFSATGQAGSFWYHSHLSTQYCDGLRGPFVVYDPRDPLKYLYDVDDASTVITLADWYHLPAPVLNNMVPQIAQSTLINGKGRWNNSGVVDTTVPLSVMSVKRGKRYRMRLISISCDPNYTFSIDGHTMTVIEADGVETKPHTVDSLTIFAGQRYSFILNANQPLGNYWIRALPNSGTTNTNSGVNSAILRYSGAPATEPKTTQATPTAKLNEWDLQPLLPSAIPGRPAPGAVDKPINLALTFNGSFFAIDGTPFISPTVPVLLQILSGAHNAQTLMPKGSVIGLPGRSSIELSLPGGVVGGGHPFHLHGHNFHVVRSAGNNATNYLNPVIRDVVNIGGLGDNVTIRFTTDNPGPWFLHCHIDWHLQAGLAVVFAEDTPHAAQANHPPPAWDALCPIYSHLSPDQL